MSDVVQESGYHRFRISPVLLGQLSALQGVFQLRNRLAVVRILAALGKKLSNHF